MRRAKANAPPYNFLQQFQLIDQKYVTQYPKKNSKGQKKVISPGSIM